MTATMVLEQYIAIWRHLWRPLLSLPSENGVWLGRRKRLSVTNLSLENNLPTFRLNAPVVQVIITYPPDDDWNIQLKHRKVIFRTQIGNR